LTPEQIFLKANRMHFSFFYGYVILALCFLNLFFMRGITGAFGIFYVALLEDYGWSHGIGATIGAINFLVYALASPLVGLAFDRLGPRVLIPFAAALVGIGLFLSGRSDSLWDLYISYGLIAALGQAGLGFVIQNALISHWFVRRRATAIGIAAMGQGLGAILLIPLTQFLISHMGWRSAFTVLAVLMLATVVPANAFLQRHGPEEVGQQPDGLDMPKTGHARSEMRRNPIAREWTLRTAMGSFPFWSITVGHLALGCGLFMIFTHVAAHMVSLGYDKLLAAFVLGLIGSMRIGATALWGFVSDHLGRDKGYGISTLITLLGIVGLVGIHLGSPMWLVYAAVILYGIGHSAGNPTYGALIADIFGGAHIGTIFGFLEVSFGLGSALGAWAGGYLYDLTGSYRLPFSLGFLTFAISYFTVHSCQVWRSRELMKAS
jgi:MFS family permease